MKTAEYKLAGGELPMLLRGKAETVTVKQEDGSEKQVQRNIPFTVKTKEAESLEEMHTLVEDGKPENVLKLAQSAYDIIAQRKVREAAASDEIADILAGKTVEINGEKLDFSTASEEERIEHALGVLQAVATDYTYGARAMISGSTQKAAAETGKKIKAAATSGALSPETLAELAKLGITL